MTRGFLLAAALAAAAPVSAGEFLREDWVFTQEPTHPNYWGVHWAVTNYLLPYRVLQRAKHEAETRWADNWRFGDSVGSAAGGAAGVALRVVVGAVGDFGLLMGPQNIHHATGHDAAAREFAHEYGLGEVPLRYSQVLPVYLGGRTLHFSERRTPGGADTQSRYLAQSMESENVFAYEQGKLLLASEGANSVQTQNFVFYRLRFLMDGVTEVGDLDQAYLDGGRRSSGRSRFSTDFTNYLYDINISRYGETKIADFRLTMSDIRRAFALQLLDPVFAAAVWSYGRDYLWRGSNHTRLPLFRLPADISYLPGFRVQFSPFGIEYYQDNYFRRRGLKANLYWTLGDNAYESRSGGGLEIWGLRLPLDMELGAFVHLHRQPMLARIKGPFLGNALSAAELGLSRLAFDAGGSLKTPVWSWGGGANPAQLFLYVRGGVKSQGWFPGSYLASGGYAQTGLGVRL